MESLEKEGPRFLNFLADLMAFSLASPVASPRTHGSSEDDDLEAIGSSMSEARDALLVRR